MGVVTGVVMPIQFGTNWSRFTDVAGNVVGPLMAYEGLIAFFLESAFLGILLFGRKRVAPGMHFASAVLVALGTLFSSFWILATNSWMQTPTGHTVSEGRIYPSDWGQIIFSPSFPYRLSRTVVAFSVTAAFVVLGVGAYTLRRAQFIEAGRVMVRTALCLLVVLVPLQAYLGDRRGRWWPRRCCFCWRTSGIGISLWPTIVPYRVTLLEAASTPSTQGFLLVGALFLLPVILMYTGWSYWVFRARFAAISGISRVKLAGIIPWFLWAFIHILFLPQLQNRRRV